MAELFDLHARILYDLKEAERLTRMALSAAESDTVYYRQLRKFLSLAKQEAERTVPALMIPGERVSSIADRIGASSEAVSMRILRNKTQCLWRDEKGQIFPPGLFKGEKMRHRSSNKKRGKK